MKHYVSVPKLSNFSRTTVFVGAILAASWNVQAASNHTASSGVATPSTNTIPSAGSTAASTAASGDAQAPSDLPAIVPDSSSASQDSQAQPLPPPSNGIMIPAPPPATALTPPPSPAALSTDAVKLATQAEQAAQQAQAQAEDEQARRDREHIQKSYDRAANGLLPLSPDQIHDFMRRLERTQEAAIPPSTGIPKGEVRVITLPLDPGVDPPLINLATGFVSTIAIVDASGEPWPILDVGVGGNFEVSPTSSGTTHVVRLMPLTRVGSGDLSILLKDLPTPVIFRLSSGGPSVDLRYDVRIPKYGPNGRMPLIEHPMLEVDDGDITMILENAPPEGAKRLKVTGLDARTMAWSLNDKVFVRTPLTLLSPAWSSSVSSADGMKVYEIGNAPVLLMSDNGAMLRGRLVQDDNHD